MARVRKSDKGFELIDVSVCEAIDLGGMGICDYCGNAAFTGVYVAVLNSWMCEKCFNEWYARAKSYPEDRAVEERNFNIYKSLLEMAGHKVEGE